jgi:hypothetical protein
MHLKFNFESACCIASCHVRFGVVLKSFRAGPRLYIIIISTPCSLSWFCTNGVKHKSFSVRPFSPSLRLRFRSCQMLKLFARHRLALQDERKVFIVFFFSFLCGFCFCQMVKLFARWPIFISSSVSLPQNVLTVRATSSFALLLVIVRDAIGSRTL